MGSTQAERHVLVISVDGMGANFYLWAAQKADLPNLKRLRAEGSFAEGVEGVYPSVTYPSHTTIVTGRMPAEHGIYSNVSVRDPANRSEDWFWYAKDIKVPTLWDEVRRAHLTSAAVSWPVTVGAAIDWNVPEIWQAGRMGVVDMPFMEQHSTPGLIHEALGSLPPSANQDEVRTRLAVYLLKQHRPNLLLIHFENPDHTEHSFGPKTPQAADALAKVDGHIGKLIQAVRSAGMASSTDIFIVSDHGFLPVSQDIRPNVLLVKAGLLTADRDGHLTGGRIATLASGGSFFIYWPDGEDLRGEVQAALKPLVDRGALWAEFERSALHDLRAEPAVKLALDASEGYGFTSQAAGDGVAPKTPAGGRTAICPIGRGWRHPLSRGVVESSAE
jgi:predicted AlkP superfamily pyrophosphatase or phosphodiesterase